MRPFLFGVGFLKGVGSAPPHPLHSSGMDARVEHGHDEVDMYFPLLRSPYP